MPLAKIIVTYKLKLADDAADWAPEFQPDSRLTDPVKKAASIEKKRAAFETESIQQPYTAIFAAVCLHCPNLVERPVRFTKEPIISRVWDWFHEHFPPGTWSDQPVGPRAANAIFLGFDIAEFLKILGLASALRGQRFPVGMWYGNTDHRDLLGAIWPSSYRANLAPAKVLAAWGIPEDWQPHVDPAQDMTLAIELATKLGFLDTD